MEIKKMGVSLLLVGTLLGLVACAHQATPSKATTPSEKATVSVPSKPASKKPTLNEEEQVVEKFLTAYTTYSSVNAQKRAIKPYLTPALQKQLAVNAPVSPSSDRLASQGENLSFWHNEAGEWLGLVTVVINGQTSQVAAYQITLKEVGGKLLVTSFSSPTQE